jgi:hypothetical protein
VTAAPRWCQGCARKPVARKRLRFCFDCQPGGPHAPPPCTRCGSSKDYWTAGKCRWCYRGTAAQPAGSCPDCHAWGTTRSTNWVCRACIGWKTQNPIIGDCMICGRQRHLGHDLCCRLCWRTAATFHTAHRYLLGEYQPLDLVTGNRHGQQLFFANLTGATHRRGHTPPRQRTDPQPRQPPGMVITGQEPAQTNVTGGWHSPRQATLFNDTAPSFAVRHGIPEPNQHRHAARIDALASQLAEQRGWSRSSLNRTRLGIRVLLGQHPGTGPIRASDLDTLTQLGIHSARLVRVVLDEAGLLDDDLTPALEQWFASKTAQLPVHIRTELNAWFEVMRHGSAIPPRRRPRAEATIRIHASFVMPPIQAWVLAGHDSLREISRDDVLTALPAGGDQRVLTIAGLRSMFTVLSGRKLVFLNPTARMRVGRIESCQPLPIHTDLIKQALHSDHPPRAALTALIAYYALQPHQVRALKLTDLHDRRLHLDGRVLLTPPAVHERISRYLDYRTTRWPRTTNPHLFINQHTAGHTAPIGPLWIARTLQLGPRLLRHDRILDEAHNAAGDVRRLCDLFDMSVNTALRYVAAVEHPDLAATD